MVLTSAEEVFPYFFSFFESVPIDIKEFLGLRQEHMRAQGQLKLRGSKY